MTSFPVIELDGDRVKATHVKNLGYLLLAHAKQFDINYGKTLPQMAREGGLVWAEVLAILQDRAYDPNESESDAKIAVLKLVDEYQHAIIAQQEADRQAEKQAKIKLQQDMERRLALRPKFLEVTAHCKNLCDLSLFDENHEKIIEHNGYVPSDLGIGADDIELTIDLDTGMIVGWKRPTDKQFQRFINVVSEMKPVAESTE